MAGREDSAGLIRSGVHATLPILACC
jgi:hypothetical protein